MPSIISFDYIKTGRRMPYWENLQFFSDRQPLTPALWREDSYYFYQNNYTGNRGVTEWVSEPTEMTCTPSIAYCRMFASEIPPETSTVTREWE